jgi:RHS repeat-associated protein
MLKNSSGDVTSHENYIYDGANAVLVLNSSGQVTERELYGPAVDQILASEAVTPVLSGPQAAGAVNWLLADNQGTVRDVVQLSDGTASVVDHLIYDAFGTMTHQSNSTYQPRFTYNGMRLDSATGLYYDAARWYDAVNSVFASQDPIGFNDGGTNLEMYCSNSPTNKLDPSGMFDGEDDSDDNNTGQESQLDDSNYADGWENPEWPSGGGFAYCEAPPPDDDPPPPVGTLKKPEPPIVLPPGALDDDPPPPVATHPIYQDPIWDFPPGSTFGPPLPDPPDPQPIDPVPIGPLPAPPNNPPGTKPAPDKGPPNEDPPGFKGLNGPLPPWYPGRHVIG